MPVLKVQRADGTYEFIETYNVVDGLQLEDASIRKEKLALDIQSTLDDVAEIKSNASNAITDGSISKAKLSTDVQETLDGVASKVDNQTFTNFQNEVTTQIADLQENGGGGVGNLVIEVLESDPPTNELYDGRIWIIKNT